LSQCPKSDTASFVKSFDSVVRVFVTHQAPNHDAPWQAANPRKGTGSGVVLSGGRILTGAHVVSDATFIQVQRSGSPEKVQASIVALCHDHDLALLRLENNAYLDGVEPAELGELPSLRSPVQVVGFPVGGSEISVTEGVVSRVEIQEYQHSRRDFIAITVDAAVNRGNSGGPVFFEDRVIGLAFQSRNDAENVGEVVPSMFVQRFLRCVDEGRSPAVPSWGFVAWPLINEMQRELLKMAPGETGVLVSLVRHGVACSDHLRVRDIITHVDGYEIANDATILFAQRHRMTFNAVLGEKTLNDTTEFVVRRDGREVTIVVPMISTRMLVDRQTTGLAPRYLVFGGLVFQPVDLNFIWTWNTFKDAPAALQHLYLFGIPSPEFSERIVIAQVLSDPLNIGFEDRTNHLVETVNGEPPRDLEHFAAMIDGANGPLDIVTNERAILLLDPARCRAANARIQERYRIPKDRSEHLTRTEVMPSASSPL